MRLLKKNWRKYSLIFMQYLNILLESLPTQPRQCLGCILKGGQIPGESLQYIILGQGGCRLNGPLMPTRHQEGLVTWMRC